LGLLTIQELLALELVEPPVVEVEVVEELILNRPYT
jgi:hypothetical protein